MEKTDIEHMHIGVIVEEAGSCTVVPGHLLAKAGERVSFQAIGTGSTVLFFPNEELFGRREVELEPDGAGVTLTVQQVEPGSYPYAVHCRSLNDFAAGGSPPRIIIYR